MKEEAKEGGERKFSRKKISKGMGLEARDFSEKIFRKFQNSVRAQLRRAPHAPGGGPPTLP